MAEGGAPRGGGRYVENPRPPQPDIQPHIYIHIQSQPHIQPQRQPQPDPEPEPEPEPEIHPEPEPELQSQPQPQLDEAARLQLYRAATRGDWTTANGIFQLHRLSYTVRITAQDETALHVAALAEKTEFVRKLVDATVEAGEDLAATDKEERTALFHAAMTGKKKLAEVMLTKKRELATIRNKDGLLPLLWLIFSGHRYREMIEFLIKITGIGQLSEDERRVLLVGLIDSDMFDLVLGNLPKNGWEKLLILKNSLEDTGLSAIARKPHMLSRSFFPINLFPCSKDVQKKKLGELLRSIWVWLVDRNELDTFWVDADGWRTISLAVENGNVEFLRILIDCYPDVVSKTKEGRTIFHVAVQHRQPKIFELIHTTGSLKKMIAMMIIDEQGTTMLHLAAQLAPQYRLESIPGEAFKLRYELQWFQEVQRVVGPQLARAKNVFLDNPQTPLEIFIEQHQKMIDKAEEQTRRTATSCTVVATLVAGAVFAAERALAGGFDSKTGYPIFLHDMSFKIFAVAVAISLVSSVTSVLMFLSLLTSTYALNDFVCSIPSKLMSGFATLSIALISMMVAFVTAFVCYFQQHHAYIKYVVPMSVASFVTFGMSLWHHKSVFYTNMKPPTKLSFNFKRWLNCD